MKYSTISAAYKSLMKLKDSNFNVKTSYEIYKAIKLLQPQVDFETESVKKLLDKHNIQLDDEGKFKFDDEKKAKKFIEEYNAKMEELMNMEIDLTYEKFSIPLTEDIKLSPADIEALEPFIDFT